MIIKLHAQSNRRPYRATASHNRDVLNVPNDFITLDELDRNTSVLHIKLSSTPRGEGEVPSSSEYTLAEASYSTPLYWIYPVASWVEVRAHMGDLCPLLNLLNGLSKAFVRWRSQGQQLPTDKCPWEKINEKIYVI